MYTAPAGKNLSNIGGDGDGTNFKANLKKIYQMFAGGGNDFDGQISDTDLKGVYN